MYSPTITVVGEVMRIVAGGQYMIEYPEDADPTYASVILRSSDSGGALHAA